MRATLELVKEQMERETQDKLERLSDEHQSILGTDVYTIHVVIYSLMYIVQMNNGNG